VLPLDLAIPNDSVVPGFANGRRNNVFLNRVGELVSLFAGAHNIGGQLGVPAVLFEYVRNALS